MKIHDVGRPTQVNGAVDEELATLPGTQPGTAIRVRMHHNGPEDYVRLEQLAHSPTIGWYVQKSFCIPADMLSTIIPELRKADCLVPRRPRSPMRQGAMPIAPLRLVPRVPLPTSETDDEPQRREA